jgi:hypothetical protein
MSGIVRLHQPNLTCSYNICLTDDKNMWTLVMKNHEDMGITDTQFLTELWNFVNIYTNTMVKQGLFDIKKEDAIPEAQAIITHDKRYTMYNIVICAVDKEITQANFMMILGQLCQNLSVQAGVELKGTMSQERRPDANI